MSKILILCWHPGKSSQLTAGGFVRLFEVLKFTKDPCIVIDKYPNLYESANRAHKYLSYTLPDFQLKNSISALSLRVITAFKLISQAARQMKDVDCIYIPFSELPQLSLVGVFLKFFYKKRLVMCNLNVNTYLPDLILNKYLHKYADLVITISKDLKKSLYKSGITVNEVNGVGFDISKKQLALVKKYDVVFVGRHTKEKGIEDLVQIVEKIQQTSKTKIKCVTIGDELNYKQILNSSGIETLGNISDAQKYKVIAESKVMAFPSSQEGWGIAPMEALSLGVPVVAYDLSIYQESIGQNKAFLTISPKDINEFANKLVDVLSKLSYYQKYAKQWKPIYSWAEVSKKEMELICKR